LHGFDQLILEREKVAFRGATANDQSVVKIEEGDQRSGSGSG
jgi:hypothetical protein